MPQGPDPASSIVAVATMKHRATLLLATFAVAIAGGVIGGGAIAYIMDAQDASDTENTIIAGANADTISVQEESATSGVVEKTKTSVVSIVITKELEQNPFPANDPFFDQFFMPQQTVPNENEQQGNRESQKIEVGEGSGFIITADGLIVTNRHVVSDEDAEYTVVFDDGTKYDAQVLARDTFNDLAILKIDAQNLTPLALGDSDSLSQGQTVIAIGNTLGQYRNTVTKGIVSGLARDLGGDYSGLIQTDAAINQGNSGGPLLNLEGQVVGINTAVDRSAGGENIGFAIPINEAKASIESVKQNGRIVRPALGVRYIQINKEIAAANNLAYEYGAYVRGASANEFGVIPGSAADKAGIIEGDIILEVDEVRVDTDHTLASLIKNHNIGDTIKLKVFHKGEEKEMEAILSELPQ